MWSTSQYSQSLFIDMISNVVTILGWCSDFFLVNVCRCLRRIHCMTRWISNSWVTCQANHIFYRLMCTPMGLETESSISIFGLILLRISIHTLCFGTNNKSCKWCFTFVRSPAYGVGHDLFFILIEEL